MNECAYWTLRARRRWGCSACWRFIEPGDFHVVTVQERRGRYRTVRVKVRACAVCAAGMEGVIAGQTPANALRLGQTAAAQLHRDVTPRTAP